MVHQIMEAAPCHRVQARRRFVEEQHLWSADDADRDVQPPAFAAGQAGDPR
jgi:hypothetical protein